MEHKSHKNPWSCYIQYSLKDAWLALCDVSEKPRDDIQHFRIPGYEDKQPISIFTYRGREALYLILKALSLPPHAKVGIPFYSCAIIAKTVVAAGLTPVFLETDPKTFGLDLEDLEKKRNDLDCLILVHTFGYPADFQEISQLLPGKPIIEDCAHAWGSSYQGRPLGTLSAASLFSFGFFKPLPLGGGGMVLTQCQDLAKKIKELCRDTGQETLPQLIFHVLRCLLISGACHATAYDLCGYLMRFLKIIDKVRVFPSNDNKIISDIMRMRPSDLRLLKHRLSLGDRNKNKESFWEEIRLALPPLWYGPTDPEYGVWNHFIFPIHAVQVLDCQNIIVNLRNMGIGAVKLYGNLINEYRTIGYQGDCPRSERFSEAIFTIPSHPALSPAERAKIVRAIKDVRKT